MVELSPFIKAIAAGIISVGIPSFVLYLVIRVIVRRGYPSAFGTMADVPGSKYERARRLLTLSWIFLSALVAYNALLIIAEPTASVYICPNLIIALVLANMASNRLA